MKNFHRIPSLICIIGALAVFGTLSCSSTDPDGDSDVTMSSLWPHATDKFWTYDLTMKSTEVESPGFFDTEEEVPDIPTMTELYNDLQQAPSWGAPDLTQTGELILAFAGATTIPGGLTAEILDSTVNPDAGSPEAPYPFMARTWYRDEEMTIGFSGYGGIDTTWIYLTDDLSPGATFSLQLARGVADDIFVHSRIWRHTRHLLNGEAMVKCVECFYVLDMGIQGHTSEEGIIDGYCHPYIYGTTLYAADIGPIYCHERQVVPFMLGLQDVSMVRYEDIEAALTARGEV